MARQATKVEYNDFTRGLITEASPLTFPENASLDELNMNINRDGSRQRRFGLDWTDATKELTNATLTSGLYGTEVFAWEGVGGDGELNIAVLQIYTTLYFFDMDSLDPGSTSAYLGSTSIAGRVSGTAQRVRFTSANGNLYFSAGRQRITECVWNGTGVTLTDIRLLVRDFWGVDDGWAIDQRVGALTNPHAYNLRNQGWPKLMMCITNPTPGTYPPTTVVYQDPVIHTNTWLGPGGVNIGSGTAVYPANTDILWAYKYAGGTPVIAINAYDPLELTKIPQGTTYAPRGTHIIDLFDRGGWRQAESGIGSLPQDLSSGSVNAIESFAGRLWCTISEPFAVTDGDERSPNLGQMVFYSKVTTETARLGEMCSEADPTSEEFSDPLPTDGGWIVISAAGELIDLVPLGESLLVFGTNGVWEIYGGDAGFTATEQSVTKVSDIGALAYESIVRGDRAVAYWTDSGIYAIQIDPTSLRAVAQNISEGTIQDFYDAIPLALRKEAKGTYDRIANQVTWLYNDEEQAWRNYYKKELVLDLTKGAFTPRSFEPVERATGYGPYPIAALPLRDTLNQSVANLVTAGGVTVTAGGVPVTAGLSGGEQSTKTGIMYWMVNSDDEINDKFYLGGYLNQDFIDFERVNGGNDAPAYILTGYLTGGTTTQDKRFPYITTNFKRTESDPVVDPITGDVTLSNESACNLQVQWEWTNDASSGRWSRPQQVYRLPRSQFFGDGGDFYFDVVNTRTKIRGKGKAASLKLSSEPLKDLHIYGWGIEVTVDR